jgi:transposase
MGFQDESSPQTVANTVRLWSPSKPQIVKNTGKIKANAMGFYPLNGGSAVMFPLSSKKEDFCDFLGEVRRNNGDRPVLMVLDNCPVHHANAVAEHAASLDIRLVFLPPYCPHLNPIEFIWKSLKRIVSVTFLEGREQMIRILSEAFLAEAAKASYASGWPFRYLFNIS